MTRIPVINHDSDDDEQWEYVEDEKRILHSRSTPPSSFKGTANAPRKRRKTRRRLKATPPHKHIHIPRDYRSPVRAGREHSFVVELPSQDLGIPGPEHGFPINPLPQEPIGTVRLRSSVVELRTQQSMGMPGLGHGSPINPLVFEPKGYPVSQRSSRIEQPSQQPTDELSQRSDMAELLPGEPASTPGPKPSSVLTASLVIFLIALVGMVCAYRPFIRSSAVTSALAPICSAPVLSLLCPTSKPRGPNSDRTPQWADFPNLLSMEGKTFESLLDETVEGPGLALEIKMAEMAASDLATLARVSKLNSREILSDSLSEFGKDARKVGRGLTRFSSKVGDTVDRYVYLLTA
jgi:hypothetical protein